ncbi:MAG: pro-sigmaK processing inhibitor BofA family protein [Clostridia bacterium]|nr:pro-sigmaK processing inhibitor BofA family protein [Clostridia bacterium]
MTAIKYSILVMICIINLCFAFKSQKPLKFLLFNAFLGVATLLILYFTKGYTGLFLTVNPITIGSSALLGVPAVILTIVLNFIILM